MYKIGLLLLLASLCLGASAQKHDEAIRGINSLDEAKSYASQYSEVSFGIINAELDVFLFDKVDMDNPSASVGQVNTIYRRRTKFLKDTNVTMLNIQVIEFDNDWISLDSANTLIEEIIASYNEGTSYWNLMKKYRNESCKFNGGPSSTDVLAKRFGSTFENRTKNDIFKWQYADRSELPVVIIIHEGAHTVPGFYAISYTVVD